MSGEGVDWFERVVLDPLAPASAKPADEPPADTDDSGPPTEEIPVVPPDPDDAGWTDFGDIVDTSEVSFEEMTGIWLTTEDDRESPLRLDGQPIEPEELDLPPDVCDRLRDWSDQWRAEWDPERGWLPRARIGDYEALGGWLARRVKDHVGALDVTLNLVDQGRAGVTRIAAPGDREPVVITLTYRLRARLPVAGDFVTESGVGSFSAELNGRLEAWAADVQDELDMHGRWEEPVAARDYADYARLLTADMADELGPDYRVELDLWESEPQ